MAEQKTKVAPPQKGMNVPPTAPAGGAAPSARPGTADATGKKEKKEKVVRVAYPGLKNEAGEAVKLTSRPTDFDLKKHKPLRPADFEDEGIWYEMKAEAHDKIAANLREKADEVRKVGPIKEKGKAKKLLQMQKRMAELTEHLKKQGVDVDALLKAAMSGSEETSKKDEAPVTAA